MVAGTTVCVKLNFSSIPYIFFTLWLKLELQWSLRRKTAPSAVTWWSLVGVRSHIGVQNVQKILFGADKGRSHKTSRSYNRGSLVAGTTVIETANQHQPYLQFIQLAAEIEPTTHSLRSIFSKVFLNNLTILSAVIQLTIKLATQSSSLL